jgi:hypothetical protein
MRDGKSILLILGLLIFLSYVLRSFLGQVSSLVFVQVDRLLFVSESIPPTIMWMLLGLLVGLIYGSFVAIRKYRLDYKLLTYPIVLLLVALSLVLLISTFIKRNDNSSLAEFYDALSKGIVAAENEEYETAERYFEQAAALGKGNSKLDSLATRYIQTANEKCKLYQSEKRLRYISNQYYKYAALLKNKPKPEICK